MEVQLPSTSVAPTGSDPTAGVWMTVQVYLVRGDRLRRVTRSVPMGDGMEPVMQALTQPLNEVELANGLRSALPESSQGPTAQMTGQSTARVSVPTGFDRLSVHDQELAVAQVVFTVTANTLASDIQFVSGTRVVPVPDDTGALLPIVARSNYADLAPVG